jgi:radical SAM protein with 4Fe4S-binding SPASM domain
VEKVNKVVSLSRKTNAFKKLLAPGSQMPVYLLMFVTNRCNASCEHCFYWRELNTKVKEELTLDEFQRLASSLGQMLQVTLTGGSPELRNDLAAITKIFHEECKPSNITFCMLGYSTERILSQVEEMLRTCPGQRFTVAISLDGIGEDHDRLRRLPGCFDKAVNTIRRLGQLKTHFPNLRIAVGTTVHGLNYQTVEHTASWVRENLPIDQLKPILVRGNPLNRDTLDKVCQTTYLNVIDRDRDWVDGQRTTRFSPMDYVVNAKENIQRDIIGQISETNHSPVVCSGGRETAVIYPDGNVAGCELRNDILGNLRDVEMDFSKIWFNTQASDFRDTTGKVPECQGCYHHCFISPAIFRTPNLWPKLMQVAWSIYKNGGKLEIN